MLIALTIFMSVAANDCNTSSKDNENSYSEGCKVTLPIAKTKEKKTSSAPKKASPHISHQSQKNDDKPDSTDSK